MLSDKINYGLGIGVLFCSGICVVRADDIKGMEDKMIVTTPEKAGNADVWSSKDSRVLITREEVEKNNGDSAVELLRDIPGVKIMDGSAAGRKQIMIRGEMPSRTLILIDGQEVTYQNASYNSSAGIMLDSEMIERIDVIKGPNSIIYGSQAIGGTINIITRKGSGDGSMIRGSAKSTYDSGSDGKNIQGALYGDVGRFTYRVSGNHAAHKDRITPERRMNDTQFGNKSVGYWLGYSEGPHSLGMSYDNFNAHSNLYWEPKKYDLYSESRLHMPIIERGKLAFFYDYTPGLLYFDSVHLDMFSQKIQVGGNFYSYVQNGFFTFFGYNTETNSTTDYNQDTHGVNLKIKNSIGGNIKFLSGVQFLKDKLDGDSNTVLGGQEYTTAGDEHYKFKYVKRKGDWEQTVNSLFTQADIDFDNAISLTAGVRKSWVKSRIINNDITGYTYPQSNIGGGYIDFTSISRDLYGVNADKSDSAITYTVGASYSGIDDTILRAAVSSGVIFPKVTQLYFMTQGGDGVKYGNPNLKKEQVTNFEIGGRYKGNDWYLDATMYYALSKNYITSFVCTKQTYELCSGVVADDRFTHYQNADSAKTYGLEMYAEYNGWPISPYLSMEIMKRSMEYNSITYQPTVYSGVQPFSRKSKTDKLGLPLFSGTVGIKNISSFNHFDLDSNVFIRASGKAEYGYQIQNNFNQRYKDDRAPWYTVNAKFNATFGKERNYKLGLDLNNILNRAYTDSQDVIPAKGFHAVLSVGVTF